MLSHLLQFNLECRQHKLYAWFNQFFCGSRYCCIGMQMVWMLSQLTLQACFAIYFRLQLQILASVLVRLEFFKGVISAGVLCCYWLLFAVVYLVPFRSNILHITYTSEVCTVLKCQLSVHVYHAEVARGFLRYLLWTRLMQRHLFLLGVAVKNMDRVDAAMSWK